MKTLKSLQKYFFLITALFLGLSAQAQAQDVILLEDFEDATLTYTTSTPEFVATDNRDFFGRIPPLSIAGEYDVTGFNGAAYFGMMDMNVTGVSLPVTLTFSSIDISGYTDLNFSILLAEDDDGSSQDWDASSDYTLIEYQIDGGGYKNLLAVEADISSGSNGEPAIDTNFNGVGDGTKITSTFAEFTAAISETGSSLDIRISASFQYHDEDISIDDVKITGTGSGGGGVTPALLLSQTDGSTDATEGGATDSFDVALSTLPSNDVTVTLTPDADVDLGSGAGVAIELSFTTVNGTSTQTVTVTAFDDSDTEDPEVSAISITTSSSDADYNGLSDQVDVNVSDNDYAASGDLIISQYYEGSSYNKYIEVTNIGTSSIDLTDYTIVAWYNANAEEYKTATALPTSNAASLDLSTLGSIEAGQTMVFAHSSAASPIPASSADLSANYTTGPFVFTGNDSIVIYNSATPNPANIVDAIGFTSNNEGGDKSFVRAGAYKGYDLTAGSSATSPQFDGIWTEITNPTADAASFGDDEFIGTTALAAVPTVINFVDAAITAAEDGVSANLTVEISNPDGVNSVSVDVVLNLGSSTADEADIDNYITETVTFPATAVTGGQQIVTVTITDDSNVEANEEAVFDLANVVTSNTNAQIGTVDTVTLSIQDNDVVIPDLIISEVADPNDVYQARFVELYNSSDSTIDLAAGNWNLARFNNGSTTGSSLALTGTVASGETYIIASTTSFDGNYSPVTADQTNSVAAGNGNDAYGLYFGGNAASGTLVDIYGVIGTDGFGETWEYEDGRAVRNADVTTPSATLDVSQWTIYNDNASTTGSNGIANVTDMTPGVHPESSVNEPTGVTASAASDAEISVAFAAIDSNDVIIVFDTDNTFTAPSGDAPSVGDSFAGGTVIYKGQVSPFAHTGLTASTLYYYSVFSVNGTDYSATTEVNATTQVAGLINSEDFNDTAGDADDWFNETVSGDDPWNLNGTYNVIVVDGGVTAGTTDDHYLISPELDLSSTTSVTITFDYAGSYDANTSLENLQLVYSTGYTGDASTTTWLPLTFDFTNISTDEAELTIPGDLVSSGQVDISSVDSQSAVRLAFRYISPDGTIETSEQWVIDNIIVQGTPATDPLATYLASRTIDSGDLATDTNGNGFTVLEEYLAGFGDGSGPDAISYGIDNDGTLALTLTSDSELEPSGITVVLQATSDLSVAFAPVAFTTSVVDNGDTTYTRSYTETSPPAGGQRFLRLSITTD